MAEQKLEWYLGERVKALAIMHLTRRNDLLIKAEVREPEVNEDLLVEIVSPQNAGWRRFGVSLRGTKVPVTLDRADQYLTTSLRRLREHGEFPYPSCLFYFTMDDNQGYFTWIAEPIVDDEIPKLRLHEDARCSRLDRDALDRIVSRVNDWYDALSDLVKI